MLVQSMLRYAVSHGLSAQAAITKLSNDYGIKVKQYDDRVVLNYSQIDSPKNSAVTNLCRGLILSFPDFHVLSRTFDRFYNLGEVDGQDHEMGDKHIFEKLDGSLISIYFDDNHDKWQIATRGTAFGEACLANSDKTYRELVLETLELTEDKFQDYSDYYFDMRMTYICEICSPENRIVTPYQESKLVLLAVREKYTGTYFNYYNEKPSIFDSPRTFTFDSREHAVEASNALQGLEEGYVVYSKQGVPLYKIKSPKYCAIHLLRGDLTFSKKRLAELVISNEQEEYLTYYPEDKKHIKPYEDSLASMLHMYQEIFDNTMDVTKGNQKEFALIVKNWREAAIFFQAKAKGISIKEAFNQQKMKYRVDILLNKMYPF